MTHPFSEGIQLLLEPLRVAVERGCTVIAEGMWYHSEHLALLPVQLHGQWCDEIRGLPMNASFAIVPFLPADLVKVNENLFDPALMHSARDRARVTRRSEQRARPRDLNYPDWEYGYERHASELKDQLLPGSAFLSMETVLPDGHTRRCSRPILGRFAVRNELRPTLIVPSARCTEENTDAIQRLARAELLLVNLQALRGGRTTAFVRAVLLARARTQPALIVAASPADLLFLGDAGLLSSVRTFPMGNKPALARARVVLVGRERPQLEREFDVTLRDLRAESPIFEVLVQLGLRAWWVANQSLVESPGSDSLVRRFLGTMERLSLKGSREAGDLNAFRSLLIRTLGDRERIEERATALEKAVEDHLNAGKGDVTVVLRQAASAQVLAERIGKKIGCKSRDLHDWGVHVRTGRALLPTEKPGLVVACGFSGFSSIDAILASRAPEAVLVMDPVEAALAVDSAKRTARWLVQAGVSESSLSVIVNASEPVALRGEGLSLSLSFDFFSPNVLSRLTAAVADGAIEKQRLVITYVDGDEVVVDSSRRFDRVDPNIGRSHTVPASSLLPGDEVVVTDDAGVFSDRLIASLDEGPLREHADRRKSWVMTVHALVDGGKLKRTEIHRQLAADAVKVTIRLSARGLARVKMMTVFQLAGSISVLWPKRLVLLCQR